MKKLALCAAIAWTALAPTAQAADCGAVMDELHKVIAGHLNMSADMRSSMMRMSSHSYDHCMIGNTKESENIRDMIMTRLKEHLGQR